MMSSSENNNLSADNEAEDEFEENLEQQIGKVCVEPFYISTVAN